MTIMQTIAWTREEALYCYLHRHDPGNVGLLKYYKAELRKLWAIKRSGTLATRYRQVSV